MKNYLLFFALISFSIETITLKKKQGIETTVGNNG